MHQARIQGRGITVKEDLQKKGQGRDPSSDRKESVWKAVVLDSESLAEG